MKLGRRSVHEPGGGRRGRRKAEVEELEKERVVGFAFLR